MKRSLSLSLFTAIVLTAGAVAGHAFALDQEKAKNYLVIEQFTLGPDQTLNEEIERLSEWVQALRNTGKHSSVRLFFHDWGSEAAFYIISETRDWGAIGAIFDDLLAVFPDFPDQPWGFAGHSDDILTEIPVE